MDYVQPCLASSAGSAIPTVDAGGSNKVAAVAALLLHNARAAAMFGSFDLLEANKENIDPRTGMKAAVRRPHGASLCCGASSSSTGKHGLRVPLAELPNDRAPTVEMMAEARPTTCRGWLEAEKASPEHYARMRPMRM